MEQNLLIKKDENFKMPVKKLETYELVLSNKTLTEVKIFHKLKSKIELLRGNLCIPENVEKINSNALYGCNPLKISVNEKNKFYYSLNNCLISKNGEIIFGCNKSIIPKKQEVNAIGENAFYNCLDMTGKLSKNFIVPDNIKIIKRNGLAIYSEDEIYIILPDSIQKIEALALKTKSNFGKTTIAFLGSPELEIGVFGSEKECRERNILQKFYSNNNKIKVKIRKGSNIENYLIKYNIPFEFF